jgi:hypothetical protein
LGFVKVVWILSVSVEHFLTEAQYMCKAEVYKSPVEKIYCNGAKAKNEKIK